MMSRVSLTLTLSVLVASVFLVGCPAQPVLNVSPTTLNFSTDPAESQTFTIYNAGSADTPLDFTLSIPSNKGWIQIVDIVGTNASLDSMGGSSTDADDKVTVTVQIDREWQELAKAYEWNTGEILISSNDPDSQDAKVTVTTAPDYLTDEFGAGFENQFMTIAFIPDGSINYYTAQKVDPVTQFPTDPFDGTPVNFGPDEAVEAMPLRGLELPFYGDYYETFFIGAKGAVSFEEPTTAENALDEHFAVAQITALSGTDAKLGGRVSLSQTFDRVAVTYEDVPNADGSGANNFQVEMFFNGEIHLTYLGVDAASGLVGLSGGSTTGATPADFVDSELLGADVELPNYNTEFLKAAAY